MHLQSISNYRALAIILIVSGHMYWSGFENTDFIGDMIRNIVTGGTAMFVFISGFMFHHVFFERFDYFRFVYNKLKNVAVPYLVLSSSFTLILYFTSSGYFGSDEIGKVFYGTIFDTTDSDFVIFLKYIASGAMLTAYWYVPFAVMLFISSPMHVSFIKSKFNFQVVVILVLSILAMFSHRPIENTNALHSLIYFTPIYLIGIMVSVHANKIRSLPVSILFILFFIVATLSFYQTVTHEVGNYHKIFLEISGVDLQFIQKVALVLFLYLLFERWDIENAWVDIISKTSFAIFFLHPWLMSIMYRIYARFGLVSEVELFNPLLYVFSVSVIIFMSVVIGWVFKYFTKGSKKTRYIIGY